MVDKKEFHCIECAGKGKARGYHCSTCDGEGNLKPVKKDKQPIKKAEQIDNSNIVNPLDLNRDGVVDEKDASIAGKVLADRRKKIINR